MAENISEETLPAKNEEISGDNEGDASEEEVYEVEKIVGMCQGKHGPLYKVRWLNYGQVWDTWEPPENLSACMGIIHQYVKKQTQKETDTSKSQLNKTNQKEQKSHKKKESMPATFRIDKNIFTAESSEGGDRVAKNKEKKTQLGPFADKKAKAAAKEEAKKKGQTWYYVSSSDEEADTLKDKFWRELEQGKIDVFSNDLYSKIKGTGRSSRPQSFKEMYKGKPMRQAVDGAEDADAPKLRKSSEEKSKGNLRKFSASHKSLNRVVINDGSSTSSQEHDTSNQKKKRTKPSLKKQDSKESNKDTKKTKSRPKESKSSSKDGPKSTAKDVVASTERKEKEVEGGLDHDVAVEMVDCDGSETVRIEMAVLISDDQPEDNDKVEVKTEAPAKLDTDKKDLGPLLLQPKLKLRRVHNDSMQTAMYEAATASEGSSDNDASNDSSLAYAKRKLNNTSVISDVELKKSKLDETANDTEQNTECDAKPVLTTEQQPKVESEVLLDASPAQKGDSQAAPLPTPLMPRLDAPEERTDATDGSVQTIKPQGPPTLVSQTMARCDSPRTVAPASDTASSGSDNAEPGGSGIMASNGPPTSSVPPNPSHIVPSASPEYNSCLSPSSTDNISFGLSPVNSLSTSLQQSAALSSMQNTVYCSNLAGSSTKVTTPDNGEYSQQQQQQQQHQRRTAANSSNGINNNNQGEENFSFDLHEAGSPTVEKAIHGMKTDDYVLELSNVELKQAVRQNDYNRVHLALKRRIYDLEQPDQSEYTLVMIAAQNGFDDLLELLVVSGARVNAELKNGSTPLMMACEMGLRCTVELLIVLGAHVNVCTTSGETAMIKAVKRGYKAVVHSLLECGCNLASPNGDESNTPLKHAEALTTSDVYHMLADYKTRLTAEFEKQVQVTLNNTAHVLCTVFPLQSFNLRESTCFKFNFTHEIQPTHQGVGMLLFIAHARASTTDARCRLYGPCAVTSVVLNNTKLQSLTEEGHFVLPFGPLLNGDNKLDIFTAKAPLSRAKLVVSAYKAKLM